MLGRLSPVSRRCTGVKLGFVSRTIVAACLATVLAHAESNREIAEWAIRWEGRVMIEGQAQPINDINKLPSGDFKIVGIDLTGTVMHPAELVKLTGLESLRELYLPGPIWSPGGGTESPTEAIKRHLYAEKSREALFLAGTSARPSTSAMPR